MTEHDDRLPLHQMLEHAREAVEMIRGRSRGETRTNRMLQLALVHLVQVVVLGRQPENRNRREAPAAEGGGQLDGRQPFIETEGRPAEQARLMARHYRHAIRILQLGQIC